MNTLVALVLKFNWPIPPKYIDIPLMDVKTKVTPLDRRSMRCYRFRKMGTPKKGVTEDKDARTVP